MGQFTTTISDPTAFQRVITDLCAYGLYQSQIPDPNSPGKTKSNPQSPQQFAQSLVDNFILGACSTYEGNQAASQAQSAAKSSVQNAIVITTLGQAGLGI